MTKRRHLTICEKLSLLEKFESTKRNISLIHFCHQEGVSKSSFCEWRRDKALLHQTLIASQANAMGQSRKSCIKKQSHRLDQLKSLNQALEVFVKEYEEINAVDTNADKSNADLGHHQELTMEFFCNRAKAIRDKLLADHYSKIRPIENEKERTALESFQASPKWAIPWLRARNYQSTKRLLAVPQLDNDSKPASVSQPSVPTAAMAGNDKESTEYWPPACNQNNNSRIIVVEEDGITDTPPSAFALSKDVYARKKSGNDNAPNGNEETSGHAIVGESFLPSSAQDSNSNTESSPHFPVHATDYQGEVIAIAKSEAFAQMVNLPKAAELLSKARKEIMDAVLECNPKQPQRRNSRQSCKRQKLVSTLESLQQTSAVTRLGSTPLPPSNQSTAVWASLNVPTSAHDSIVQDTVDDDEAAYQQAPANVPENITKLQD